MNFFLCCFNVHEMWSGTTFEQFWFPGRNKCRHLLMFQAEKNNFPSNMFCQMDKHVNVYDGPQVYFIIAI